MFQNVLAPKKRFPLELGQHAVQRARWTSPLHAPFAKKLIRWWCWDDLRDRVNTESWIIGPGYGIYDRIGGLYLWPDESRYGEYSKYWFVPRHPFNNRACVQYSYPDWEWDDHCRLRLASPQPLHRSSSYTFVCIGVPKFLRFSATRRDPYFFELRNWPGDPDEGFGVSVSFSGHGGLFVGYPWKYYYELNTACDRYHDWRVTARGVWAGFFDTEEEYWWLHSDSYPPGVQQYYIDGYGTYECFPVPIMWVIHYENEYFYFTMNWGHMSDYVCAYSDFFKWPIPDSVRFFRSMTCCGPFEILWFQPALTCVKPGQEYKNFHESELDQLWFNYVVPSFMHSMHPQRRDWDQTEQLKTMTDDWFSYTAGSSGTRKQNECRGGAALRYEYSEYNPGGFKRAGHKAVHFWQPRFYHNFLLVNDSSLSEGEFLNGKQVYGSSHRPLRFVTD